MRPTTTLTAVALSALPTAALAAAPGGPTADLTLDGRVSTTSQLGAPLAIELSGAQGQLALVAVDVDPGPVELFGQSVPIGLTPALTFVAEGNTGRLGTFASVSTLPSDPALEGVTFHLVGVLVDVASLGQPLFSNGADVTLTADLAPVEVDLVGKSRPGYPHFDWITTVPEGDPVELAIDPTALGFLADASADVYVVADRSQAEWNADPTLTDLSGDGPDAITFAGTDILSNIFVADAGLLSGDGGASLGVAYDLVVDLDGDGLLSNGDLTDGYADGAGFYVTRDPSLPGPYAVTEILYSGGTWLGQNLFYPSNVAELDTLPLVIVSHGNGHNYQWYNHIGNHLASYGYVVMSHENQTGPGPGAASNTTLNNTDYLLGNLDTIAGGALLGKLDSSKITWIGHSRGGEGVVRAYDKLFDGTVTMTNYGVDDIVLVSSIAATVFAGITLTNPHDVDYHVWVGAADSDVSGCVASDVTQPFQIFGRATAERSAISLYGVGHAWFHNGGGGAFAAGPCQIGRQKTHQIMRGYLLPLVEFKIRGNRAGKDYLWRHYEDLHPQSKPDDPCIVANLQWVESEDDGKVDIDSFEASQDPFIASSGATLTTDLADYTQLRMDDGDSSLSFTAADTTNGMTYASSGDKEWSCLFSYDGTDQVLAVHMTPELSDWTGHRWLSFRAAQRTRQPLTLALLADEVFEVRLVDEDGDTSTIRIDALLAGLEEPYQRSGCGTGTGWGNEFETVRIGLRGFTVGAPELDLDAIDRLEFLFGPSHGSASGSLGIDDIELHAD